MSEKLPGEGEPTIILRGPSKYDPKYYEKPKDPERVEFEEKFKGMLSDPQLTPKDKEDAFQKWKLKKQN